MYKNELLTILNDWNFWRAPLDTGVERCAYLKQLQQSLQTRQILVITGARRSGKSYLMRQLAQKLINSGTKTNNILMVNFEDPRLVNLDAQLLQKIYEIYLETLNPQGQIYIFLDEVQEVKKWEKWVQTIHELKKARLIISGSNAKLLGQEFSTLLTGRHLNVTVYPLSFREFLKFRNITITDTLDLIDKRIEIKRHLSDYLEFGSFPEVVLSPQRKKELLLAYFEDIIHKDLIRRYNLRKPERLTNLGKFLLTNISAPMTFRALAKATSLSTPTAENYSLYLQNAYLAFFLKRFSFKVKEQDRSSRKVYALDTGLANAVGSRFSENIGRIAENVVFIELLHRHPTADTEIFYWQNRGQKEIDFIVKENQVIKRAIQVCWQLGEERTRNREIKNLLKGLSQFKLDEGLIITGDEEGEEYLQNKKISFVPLWKWLLN